MNREQYRLIEDQKREKNWKRWGPYLSERQWGTVREDYSSDGNSWNYLTHDDARKKAYRWGEDGLLGITDRQCRICFCLCMWNGKDPILKERLFGLSGPQGNHGEDVKEIYFYVDSLPTHSYMKAIYKYPINEFPYGQLVEESAKRGYTDREFELEDTGVFKDSAYFDVVVQYAKGSPNDILIHVKVHNRSASAAPFHFLPNIWFRNTWSWDCGIESGWSKPTIEVTSKNQLHLKHHTLPSFTFCADRMDGEDVKWLLTNNETTDPNLNEFANGKDAFHQHVIHGKPLAEESVYTKAAPYYQTEIPAGDSKEFCFRLFADAEEPMLPFGPGFDRIVNGSVQEADDFYLEQLPKNLTHEETAIMRQANAGLLWTKQFYHYVIEDWLKGDEVNKNPPAHRGDIRNGDWQHLFNRDIVSMPDKWEYPWFAAWDTAFHMIPFAELDPSFAKDQLVLFLREWYMHPNGQIPAYEWAFDDVNPPVHAWACWQVYQLTGADEESSRTFLSRTFQKLIVNFTWWINQKDIRNNHVFSGGFLGLDNIGIFDRSKPLPTGGHLEQADATAWMAFYCSSMLMIALELAHQNPAYGDMASKFFEHYIAIAEAMNHVDGRGLWDEQDGFYYDHIFHDGKAVPLRIRSLVGLIPLITVAILDENKLYDLDGFNKRKDWFLEQNDDISERMTFLEREHRSPGKLGGIEMLAVPSQDRLRSMLGYMLDENEFLSPFGIRSLSKFHEENPYQFHVQGDTLQVKYIPGESDSGMFGGNSNWRGPIWFPLNYLIIESLLKYHRFYGDQFEIECPTGSGNMMNLQQVAFEIRDRLIRIFEKVDGKPAFLDGDPSLLTGPNGEDLYLFYEYFHGCNGRGLGASHQTGWTALVSRLLRMKAEQNS